MNDTERLDWLKKNKQSLFTVWIEKRKPKTDGSHEYYTERTFCGWSVESRFDELDIRDAIDAAITHPSKKPCQ